ncbi:hypothetical protein T459_30953 [Capsicum annuum]|uniref:(+)-neomenthol dehydrogenase-like n=1 Tax=Capsicum annuum TaxID=4072 RepID=A0A2G2Y9V5_CAPAN|nr:hypothetical protein T459_30953 [Capsicum annuum]
MATLIFEDMIGDYHLKAQDLVSPRAQEYARKTHFEPTIEHIIHQVRTIAREPAASTSEPMDNNATNVILAFLDTMSQDLAMANERLDRMVGQRVQVGCPDTLQDEFHSSCELRGKNAIPYAPIDLEYCVVASRSQVGVVADLPRVEVLESPFCDTLGIVRSHEDQTRVVGMQVLVDPLDDEIDSPYENDWCPSSASTYNLTKVPLPSAESIHILVDPCEKQGESTFVYKLPTTSENMDNDQSGGINLDVLDCLGNPNCDCLGKYGFACDLLAVYSGLCLSDDCSFEKEGDVCLEISSTSSLSVSYVGYIPSGDFETSSKCMQENPLFEVGCETPFSTLFLYMIFPMVCSSDWGDKGIGYETCKQLASKGVVVVLTSRDEKRDIQAIERLKEESNFTDEQILFHQLDVMDPTSISSLVNFIKTKFGRLDILEGLTEELPIKEGLLTACLYLWHGTNTLPARVTGWTPQFRFGACRLDDYLSQSQFQI